MEVLDYIWGRWRTLYPVLDYDHSQDKPIRLFASLDRRQWGYFLIGWLAWTWDAFDYHTVTITYTELSKTFDKSVTTISHAVTASLAFRFLGAAVFGFAADRYGRRWPFIINCIFIIVFELATGFCQTFQQFFAVRSLFGFGMGGIWGNAAATALEDLPGPARGLMSGIYQSGFPFGYLLAVSFWKAFDGESRHGWRVLFWFGGVPPILLIIARWKMQETETYRSRRRLREPTPNTIDALESMFWACRQHWRRLLYLALVAAGLAYASHDAEDLYPTMLQNRYGFNSSKVTRVQVTGHIGAIIGGITIGYSSQIVGRRFAMICMCILGGMLLYPYAFTSGPGLYAAAFFELFFVFGAWGVVPIYLIELSPPAYRTFVVGTSYHLGTLMSAPSNIIMTRLGEHFPLPSRDGEVIYDYRAVICIVVGIAFACTALVVSLGPEMRGADLRTGDIEDLR